jgi:hypothetical protein
MENTDYPTFIEDQTAELAAIEKFIHGVVSAFNQDYGDWMRETNLYWMNLSDSLMPILTDSRLNDKLQELHEIIQFEPSWHPIETSRAVIEIALDMRRLLGAIDNRDPSDFGLSMTDSDPKEAYYFDPERDVLPPRLSESVSNGK